MNAGKKLPTPSQGKVIKLNRRVEGSTSASSVRQEVRFLSLTEASEMTNLSVALLRRAATDPTFPVRLKGVRFTPRGKLWFTEEQILKFAQACMNLGKSDQSC